MVVWIPCSAARFFRTLSFRIWRKDSRERLPLGLRQVKSAFKPVFFILPLILPKNLNTLMMRSMTPVSSLILAKFDENACYRGLLMSDKRLHRISVNNLSPEDLCSLMEQLEDAYCSMLREKDSKNEDDLVLLNNIYHSIVEIKNILRERKDFDNF